MLKFLAAVLVLGGVAQLVCGYFEPFGFRWVYVLMGLIYLAAGWIVSKTARLQR
jgi:uncharacterized membrane protein HdeD (DUF308 family)